MSARSHAGRSHETLPAIRSSSPPALHKSANKISSESLTLPPIQSLTRELPPRIDHAHNEPVHRHSPPEHAPPYHRKRSAPGLPADSASPPNSFKRRKVDLLENNGLNQDLPAHSHAPLPGHSELQPRSQHVLDPPTAPSVTHGHSSRPLPPRGQNFASEHRRHLSTGSNIPFPSHEPILKQEQISPPAVVVQSPATPSTAGAYNSSTSGWQNEPSSSFSRRISSASSNRSTSRKQPPSHLNFQSNHRSNGSLDSIIEPSIRSAPPVPVPGQLAAELAMKNNGIWQNSRAANTNRVVHPGRTSDVSSKVTVKDTWPSIPTPTSLRLGARAGVNPPPPPNAPIATASSPSGRLPLTPAVPSPIPPLGSGTAVTDKAKFMQRMSDIYDKASAHKGCLTAEEFDRKLKDVLMIRDQEIIGLKKEVGELRRLLTERKTPSLDKDGDAVMTASTARPSRTLSGNAQPNAGTNITSSQPTEPKDAAMKTVSPTSKSPEEVTHSPKSTAPPSSNGKRIPSASPEASNSTTTE